MAERVLVLSISILVEEGRFHGLEDVLRSHVVEPSQRQAGRDASTPQARSLGWWETPGVTPRTSACPPHTGAEQCSSRQGRRHIYTPSSYSESGG
jgi:hypothetical protein